MSNQTYYWTGEHIETYVSLRLRVQNGISRLISAMHKLSDFMKAYCGKWNFPLNFHTMPSDLYSGIFQTQSSGCASCRPLQKLHKLNNIE